eukprot:2792866-Rhodomonas_salina.3
MAPIRFSAPGPSSSPALHPTTNMFSSSDHRSEASSSGNPPTKLAGNLAWICSGVLAGSVAVRCLSSEPPTPTSRHPRSALPRRLRRRPSQPRSARSQGRRGARGDLTRLLPLEAPRDT